MRDITGAAAANNHTVRMPWLVKEIKGPDNPTNQLLPMITSRCENETGNAGRKGDGARQVG